MIIINLKRKDLEKQKKQLLHSRDYNERKFRDLEDLDKPHGSWKGSQPLSLNVHVCCWSCVVNERPSVSNPNVLLRSNLQTSFTEKYIENHFISTGYI